MSSISRTILGPIAALALAIGALVALPPAEASATSIATSTVKVTAGSWSVKALVLKNPSATCRRTKAGILPPSDRGKVCRYGVQIIGHAYPKPKKAGYAQKFAAKAKVGGYVWHQGHVWRVTSKRSIRKGRLPAEAWLKTSTTVRYLVTCDPKSGYRNGHSRNNLVVRMVRVR